MLDDKLTCGERAVRCLIGEPIDHVPYGVGIGWGPWSETLDRWKNETSARDLNPQTALGFEDSFIIPDINSGFYPWFETQIIEETDEHVIYRDPRGIVLRAPRNSGNMPEWLEYPVKTPADWERLKEERIRIDRPERMTQDWDEFRTMKASRGASVQVGQFPWGVFGTVRDFLGVEEMLVSFYTEPEMIRDMMNHLTTLWISLWERVAAEVQIDHIHIWEDMSGKQGSLISPGMVEEFMMPCYDRIAEFGRSVGARVISVDTDGKCDELVPIMIRHGVNAFLPFEVQAGNDILEYGKLYPELGIIGGLDKRALALTREDIDIEVTKAKQMIERGRYIPGFDHLIPPDVSWENFRYAAEEIRRICFSSRGC